MSFGRSVGVFVLVLMGTFFVAGAYRAEAAIDWEARRAEREADREARAAEREARRLERETEREERAAEREARREEANQEGEQEEASTCECSSRLSLAKSELVWRGDKLVFIPRVDLSVRSRGEVSDPALSVTINFEGETSYSSDSLGAPAGQTFSGEKAVLDGAMCGSDYRFGGMKLGEVELTGVLRSLFSLGKELDGQTEMKAGVEGCGDDEEWQQMGFEVGEFGNLSVGRWRRAR